MSSARDRLRQVAFLAAGLLLIALATSRIALVGHELIGHGSIAELSGAEVTDWRLYWFGGGWVSFRWPEVPGTASSLAVSLGGIGFELVLGALALILAARLPARGGMARLALVAMAGIVLLHAGFYLAAGTHHGFGDGRLLHRLLGERRWVLVAPVALAVVLGGFWFGGRLAGELDGIISGGALARASTIVIASLLAAGGHAALTAGEQALARDQVHASVMQHQSEREVRRDLADYARRHAAEKGKGPSPAELARVRAQLARKHRRFPLREVLAVALAAACLAGLARAVMSAARQPTPVERPRWTQLVPLALLCAVSLLAVGLVSSA